MSFKEKNRLIQEYVRQLSVLRAHNLSFSRHDSQATYLPLAEASHLICTLEAFVRILPDLEAMNSQTLNPILQFAIARNVLKIHPEDFKFITDFRNRVLHGNILQIASEQKLTIEEYCKNQFLRDIEKMTHLVSGIFSQIDPETGKPFSK